MTEEHIKKLEDQLEWYKKKLEELNNLHYSEGTGSQSKRYIKYQLEKEGFWGLIKKLLNPIKVFNHIRYLLQKKRG